MWSVWLVFCHCGFHSFFPLIDKDKRFVEVSWWERLTVGKQGLVLMGGACSVNLWSSFLLIGKAVFPPCCLTWDQTTVKVVKIMVSSFKRSHACTVALSAPYPASDHRQSMPLPETPGHTQASLGQSLVGSLLLSPGSWCTQTFVCVLQESVSPILCTFWWLYGGVNGNLLQ